MLTFGNLEAYIQGGLFPPPRISICFSLEPGGAPVLGPFQSSSKLFYHKASKQSQINCRSSGPFFWFWFSFDCLKGTPHYLFASKNHEHVHREARSGPVSPFSISLQRSKWVTGFLSPSCFHSYSESVAAG